MPLKRKPSNSRSKIVIFSAKIKKMFQCVKQLTIPQSIKILFNNYTMKAVIKEEKVLINGLQTGISVIIYMQKLRHMYSHMKNVNAMTPPNLKKLYIQLEQLFYGKKWALMLFTCLLIEITIFLLLHVMTYLGRLKQNLYTLFYLKLLRDFSGKMLFAIMVFLEN